MIAAYIFLGVTSWAGTLSSGWFLDYSTIHHTTWHDGRLAGCAFAAISDSLTPRVQICIVESIFVKVFN